MKVAYQGEPGAYSEDAVRATFPAAEAVPRDTVRHVFNTVASGEAAYGVAPLENSQAGSINETYGLLLHDDRLGIVGEIVSRVDHALLGIPGAEIGGVRWVYSHPQALAQCDEFLSDLRVEVVPVLDTAGAARRVAGEGDPQQAAIASVRAGALQGLVVLAERIQTYKENLTKFAVIGDEDPGLGEPDKTSVLFTVADRPGSLFACLEPYARRGLNLAKLESRPRPGAPFEYVFYMDVEAPLGSDLEQVLAEMKEHTSLLKVLGTYPAWRGQG